MLIIKLQGGLGNQMFQYAYGRSLAVHLNTSLKLDVSFLNQKPSGVAYTLRDFSLTAFKLDRLIVEDVTLEAMKSGSGKFLHKISHSLVKRNIRPIVPTLLQGYWQSEVFFESISQEIRQTFTFPESQNPELLKLKAKIRQQKNTVSVHVRRGDYLKYQIHNVCTDNYFNDAIKRMKEKKPSCHFYIFSDDIPTCRKLFGKEVVYVEGLSDVEDLSLMSQCKHSIISNSSFSWWGAWLGEVTSSYIIAPNKWFNDTKMNDEYMNIYKTVPERWEKLKV